MHTFYQAIPPVNTLPASRRVPKRIQDDRATYAAGKPSRKPRVTAPFVKLPTSVLKNKDLSAWARLVYPLLLDYKTERGIFPGRDRLADDLGISIPTVDRALNELCAAGLIEKQRQGRGNTSRYVLLDGTASGHEPYYESSPVMTHTDDLSPVTSQNDDESSPVMTPLKEVEQDTLTPPLPPRGKRQRTQDGEPEDFLTFWSKYPPRKGKKATRAESLEAWGRMSGADRSAALAAVDSYARSETVQDGYAIDAVRWLKRRRWIDEAPTAAPSQNGVPDEMARLIEKREWLSSARATLENSRYRGTDGQKFRKQDLAEVERQLAELAVAP